MHLHSKNRLMFQLALGVVILSVITHAIYQNQSGHHGSNLEQYRWLTWTLFVLPLISIGLSAFGLFKGTVSRVPLYNTLTLTLSSISIIAGAGGRVEFHFSIFMVIAIIAYYESISLILISTAIFAVQHLGAGLFLPDVVFGDHEYSFSMVLVHALFLIFTSASTIVQIRSGKRYTAKLEEEKREKDRLIRETTEQVRETSVQLVQIVQALSRNAVKSLSSVEEVAEAIGEVNDYAGKQAISSNESAGAMEEMAVGIQRIAESSNRLADASVEMVERSEAGSESVLGAIDQLDRIKKSTLAVSEAAAILEANTQRIGGIAATITDISAQTNLLALNASIEAARAGEFGRGFGIVASEVRKLAEQSKQSAMQIASLIEQVQISTDVVVNRMADGVQEVERGSQIVKNAGHSFASILERAHSLSDRIGDISAASEQMSAGSEQVVASIDEISQSSGDIASRVQTVSSSSQEQRVSMEDITQSIRNVESLVQSLDKLVGQLSN
ncbi:methyl-accepting chemotaxis protein [Cohnella herbarum]|uniref:Methyl-accepting chemotaxis protein n=1 Tax=Cohnella herbarum TaxID=2728023 RepID=A0A7Z2VK23_9BACL|nr:methyl-accepting chemotaxis protein [Cohnella herbarum]QJD84415.1 methyl-accepting chemotaxis protein [Cohnella herbarum]